jgi:hypothetical protein
VRQALARSLPGRSLIELWLEAPRGPVDAATEQLFLEGLQRLEAALGVGPVELRQDAAGYQGVFVTEMPALLARRRASRVEAQAGWDCRLGLECYGMAGGLGTTGRVPREVVGPAR